ncbi:ATP-binding cassette subfamily C protein CydC [Weissella beninensis]|uniref:Thiol reductant ABC exporter subunit CydC n=1 Tax=Periweissella beninensis TaxID=504936 RepID=A0ABT0VGA6_9LACO|nr:thiol reductant ABC exporter subunit CydC [Periweissella beninensis]MBM7544599.1 ATP-binding cassette subfamily C protein CydC [Periweissella beninensis]MCM2436866.1 thiol reductant ABC exporter subunit CydC [Periweissella beninensis]
MKKFLQQLREDSWVLPYLRKNKKLLVLVIFLGFMTVFCGTALMFTSGYLISRSAQHPTNVLLVYVPIVLTRAFGIGRPTFRYVERLTSHNWVLKLVSNLRRKLYQSLESTTMTIRQKYQTGDVLAVLADDIDHIENLYLRTIFPIIIGWLLYLAVGIFIGTYNWLVGILMLVLFGCITILVPIISLIFNGVRMQNERKLQQKFYTELTDTVLGLSDWVIANRQKDLIAKQDILINQQSHLKRINHHFDWWRDFIIQLIVVLIVIGMLWFTSLEFGSNVKTVNWIAAFVLAIFPLIDAFKAISEGLAEVPIHHNSLVRMNSYQNSNSNINDIPNEVIPQNLKIDIKNVSYTYPVNTEATFKNLNLVIPMGSKIAVLGPSGAGKTTLLNMILGDLNPQLGSITLGGENISKWQTKRSTIFAVLDQRPYLFNTTILNNIRLGNLGATDEQVKAAIAAVGLKEMVEALPNGYLTIMTEGGQRFSGGEQQRFALARILLQDTPIIILDEPTVSLDPITENSVLETVFKLFKDKTIIWVTHHLIGINHVDQVVFLNDGKIEMHGQPNDLYRTNQKFKQLLDLDRGLIK